MKKTVRTLGSVFALGLLSTACSQIPPEAAFNRGAPESLLDISSEVVKVSLADGGLEELASWINQEQPTRADLACDEAEYACGKARDVLSQFDVPFEKVAPNGEPGVALYYERLLARDCEHRYIDNPINPYGLNHPTFGCATAANMVQQVSDKRQFVNPNLLAFPDGEKSVQIYNNYMKNNNKDTSNEESQLKAPTQ